MKAQEEEGQDRVLVMEGGVDKSYPAGDDPCTQGCTPDVRTLIRCFEFLVASKKGYEPCPHKGHQDDEAHDTSLHKGGEVQAVAVTRIEFIVCGIKRNASFLPRPLKIFQGDAIPVAVAYTKDRIKTCGLERHIPDKVTVREGVVSILNGNLFLDDSGIHDWHEG